MKTESYILSDYNLNIISINQLISNSIEAIIEVYCFKINYVLSAKKRDTKNLIFHFVADSILQTLCKCTDTKNILIFADVKKLTILPNDLVAVFNSVVRSFVKKFKLCTYFTESEDVNYTGEIVYQLKQLSDSCSIKDTNLSKIKKFLRENEFKHLSNKLSLDLRVKHVIMST